jgi:5-methyltetrahydrofolate--homocysteine methyltransferase
MKAAVAHLEPHMEKNDEGAQDAKKIVLATVKGDVHDIGKNLVDIILSNNGYEVINLGIKIPPEDLIKAIREHNPDLVGLSGLLVKSAQQMVTTANDLSKAGIKTPILVGGAALSRNFVDKSIAPNYGEGLVEYAQDAMNGLSLANDIVKNHEEVVTKVSERRKELAKQQKTKVKVQKDKPVSTRRSTGVQVFSEFPSPPDLDPHVITNTPLQQVWDFINPLMLYGRHLGLKGRDLVALRENKDLREHPKALKVRQAVDLVKQVCAEDGAMEIKAKYQFFPAYRKGNSIVIEGEKDIFLDFPRQPSGKEICLSDYLPDQKGDHVALFCVTAGRGIMELSKKYKDQGSYVQSHALQALALETAEGYAEYLHTHLRNQWGFPDPPHTEMKDRFQAKYRGKRYSFGYPACPNLEDQVKLFELLKPEDIGVQLTEGFMMEPEASVSAIVFHHPDASYFSVGKTILEQF